MNLNIFSWFNRKKDKQEIKEYPGSCSVSTGGQQAIQLQSNSLLAFALGYADGSFRLTNNMAMSLYGQSSALATSVDITLQELANINPVIEGPDKTLDDSSEVLDLLKNPNDYNENWPYFITNLGMHFLLTGNSHLYMAGNVNLKPLELYTIKPQNTNVVQGQNTYPWYYTINQGIGSSSDGALGNNSQYGRTRTKTGFRYYTQDQMREIWHIRRQSASSQNIYGDSPIKAICLDINQQIKGRLHNSKLLDNGARPSAAAIFKDTMSPDQHNERRQLINEQLAGADNAGKIAVISSSDMELIELGINNKDMDYSELDKISSMATYNRYRIPLPIVINDKSTYDNLSTSVESLYEFAIIPTANILFQGLSMALMPRFKLDPSKYKITYDPDSIGALKEKRLKELRERKEIGVESINEIRASMSNRDPVEGGDDILVQSTMIPIGSVGIESEETDLTAEEEAEALAERDGANA